jgi:hypothetical protein
MEGRNQLTTADPAVAKFGCRVPAAAELFAGEQSSVTLVLTFQVADQHWAEEDRPCTRLDANVR